MFSPGLCKSIVGMPDWGCGAHNHGNLKDTCNYKKKKKQFYTSPTRFHPDKAYKYKKYHKFKQLHKHKFYLKRRNALAEKEKCFICEKKGLWANKCPSKKKKPHFAALFTNELDPAWWDLAFCSQGEYPEGEVVFHPFEDESNNDPTPALAKFGSSDFSSSESDTTNLGWCDGPPKYSFWMFSISKFKDINQQQRIVEIDK